MSASASSELPISFSATGSCSVSENQITINNIGKCTITASQEGNTNYNAATNVEQSFNVTDNQKPIFGEISNITQEATSKDGNEVEFKVTATDNYDEVVKVTCTPKSGSTFAIGTTTVNCSASDSSDNTATTSFIVKIQDTTKPVITINGNATTTVYVGDVYTDQGATAQDNIDGDITKNIEVKNMVNTSTPGSYLVTYDVMDKSGNEADQKYRTVVVSNRPSSGGGGGGGIMYYTVNASKTGSGTGTVSGGSLDCGNTCNYSFASGSTVVFTATSSATSTFTGWTGDCLSSGSNSTCTLVISGIKNIGANFSSNNQIIPTDGMVLGSSTLKNHPNGTVIIDGKTIYLVANNKLNPFRTFAEFNSYHYRPSQIVKANKADLALAKGDIVKAMPGTLVLDLSDGKVIYIIGQNFVKHAFVSLQVFRAFGYSLKNVVKINLSDYQAGDEIASATQGHPDGSLHREAKIKTVWWNLGNNRQGFESEAVYYSYGLQFASIVATNLQDMTIGQGSLIKLRDGSLVKDGQTYYIISDGKKIAFKNLQTLKAWGYNQSNIINYNLSSYNLSDQVLE